MAANVFVLENFYIEIILSENIGQYNEKYGFQKFREVEINESN